jgi:hypothetical protein
MRSKGDGAETFMVQQWFLSDFPNSPQCASIRGRNGVSGRFAVYDFINRAACWRRKGLRLTDDDLDFFVLVFKLWQAWWKQNFGLRPIPPMPKNIASRIDKLVEKRRKQHAQARSKLHQVSAA